MENVRDNKRITALRRRPAARAVAAFIAVFLFAASACGKEDYLTSHSGFSADAAAYDDVTPTPGVIVDDGGSVPGLPEGITILDSDGVAVDPEGDYWFWVEDMNAGETYTKTMSLMNLRDDGKKYRMYFYIEPREMTDEGINLLENCGQQLYLDGSEFYNGNVWGSGNIEISAAKPVNLGVFEPGKTKTFKANITWNGAVGSADKNIGVDNGHRLIDENTVNDPEAQYIREPSGEGKAYGDVYFHWVFYAEVIEDVPEDVPDDDTSIIDIINHIVKTGDPVTLGIWFVCIAASITLFVLIIRKKRQDGREEKSGNK